MTEWQPIETAPKDGKPIILWFPYWSNIPMVAHYGCNQFNRLGWIGEYILSDDGDMPTHWHPLPAPPQLSHERQRN